MLMRVSLAPVALFAFTTATVVLYLLPLLIGWVRRVPDLGVVAVIDLFLGWSFVGWVVALALALLSRRPADPVLHIVRHCQELPPAPGFADETGWAGRPGAAFRTGPPPPLSLPPRPTPWPNVPGWDPWAGKNEHQQ
jgi:hypothetical protein